MPQYLSFARCFAALCLLVGVGLLASNVKAQATMYDIGDYNWFYNGWSQPGDTLPDADFTQLGNTGQITGGGNQAEYQLPRGWFLYIVNIQSDYVMDVVVERPASTYSAGLTVDTQTGTVVSSHDFYDATSGLTLHLEVGTPGNDMIQISSGFDVALVFGLEGDDLIQGDNNEACVFFGGDGDDEIEGANSIDFLYGDWIGEQYNSYVPTGGESIYGHGESDLILGGPSASSFTGADYLFGGAGPDEVYGNSRYENYGYTGWNHIEGDGSNDWLFGGEETDHIEGGDNSDLIEGGGGEDVLYGDASCDDIWGDYGVNLTNLGFSGNGDADEIYGGDEDDFILGGEGLDIIDGGAGDDAISGGDGADVIDGGDGHDVLMDEDTTGGDWLLGGDGDDYLLSADGSTSADNLRGEADDDQYWWDNPGDSIVDNQGSNTINTANSWPGAYTGATEEARLENLANAFIWGGGRSC